MQNRMQRFQKSLRLGQTEAEARLWYHLRNRHFQELKFKRQHILQGYIVDFVCLEKKLIIELDGGQHMNQQVYDKKRTSAFKTEGFQVLRFWNSDVLNNTEKILEMIYYNTCVSEKTEKT